MQDTEKLIKMKQQKGKNCDFPHHHQSTYCGWSGATLQCQSCALWNFIPDKATHGRQIWHQEISGSQPCYQSFGINPGRVDIRICQLLVIFDSLYDKQRYVQCKTTNQWSGSGNIAFETFFLCILNQTFPDFVCNYRVLQFSVYGGKNMQSCKLRNSCDQQRIHADQITLSHNLCEIYSVVSYTHLEVEGSIFSLGNTSNTIANNLRFLPSHG